MAADNRDMGDFLADARNRREKNDEVPQTDIPYSEYNKIIMLCHSYFQSFIESYSGQPMMMERRNRIFQIIELIAIFRKGLPTVSEYFEDRPVGIFDGTIAEFEALEYVNVIQNEIMKMNDPQVDVGMLDDELEADEEIE